MKKGRMFAVLIAVVMITISFTGCFGDDDKDDEESLSYKFEIVVLMNQSLELSLKIPLPLYAKDPPDYNQNDSIAYDIIDNLKLPYGKCNYQINTTKYGNALNIFSNASFSLKSEGKLSGLGELFLQPGDIYLSMMAEYDKPNWVTVSEKYWVYSNNNNSAIKITLEIEHQDESDSNYNSDWVYLKEGWQIIDIKEHIMIV